MQVRFTYLPFIALVAFCAGRMSNQGTETEANTRQAREQPTPLLANSIGVHNQDVASQPGPTKELSDGELVKADQLAAALRAEQDEKNYLAAELAKAQQLIAEKFEAERVAAAFIEDVAHDPIQWSLGSQDDYNNAY